MATSSGQVGVSSRASARSLIQPVIDAINAAAKKNRTERPTKLAVVTSLAQDGSGMVFVRFEGDSKPSSRPLLPILGAYPFPQVGDRVQLLVSGKTWVVVGAVTGGAPMPPVGSVTAFAGASAPPGWLVCDGSSVSADDYPALYAVIGETFGDGGDPDDDDTFSLPDLRGGAPLGVSDSHALGSTGGSEQVQLTLGQMPWASTATVYPDGDSARSAVLRRGVGASASAPAGLEDPDDVYDADSGTGNPVNVLGPYVAMTFIIRAG